MKALGTAPPTIFPCLPVSQEPQSEDLKISQQRTVEADEVAPGGHGSGREEATLGADEQVPGSHQG